MNISVVVYNSYLALFAADFGNDSEHNIRYEKEVRNNDKGK